MTVSKIKSSASRRFLNTMTTDSPLWALMNKGIPTMSTAYNAEVTSETYVAEDNASNSVDSYAPNSSITQTAFKNDSVFEFVDNLRKTRAIQKDAETEILDVYVYDEDNTGVFVAEKNNVVISIDTWDLNGGQAISIGYTISFNGDPEMGTATIVDGKPVFTKA